MSEQVEKLSTVQDLVQRFKVSDKTIRRWINSGQIEAFTLGRQLRFEEKEIKRFMNLRRRAKERQTSKRASVSRPALAIHSMSSSSMV